MFTVIKRIMCDHHYVIQGRLGAAEEGRRQDLLVMKHVNIIKLNTA